MNKVTIDGLSLLVEKGTTILEAALQAGLNIPTLCYRPELKPEGVCRVCLVELGGSSTLVGACHTKVEDGMIVWTRSPKATRARELTIELLMARHDERCVCDQNSDNCRLHALADSVNIKPSGIPRKLLPQNIENRSQVIWIEQKKCILCCLCIRACHELANQDILALANRASDTRVVFDVDRLLHEETCINCGICVDYCPTGAISMEKERT
jgi:NADP-reducing hydrogenase subunit HndD